MNLYWELDENLDDDMIPLSLFCGNKIEKMNKLRYNIVDAVVEGAQKA